MKCLIHYNITKTISVAKKINKNTGFQLTAYFENIDSIIQNILSRSECDTLTYDILDTENSMKDKLIALKVKQRQMKVGEIWQEVLGNYDGYINLRNGHESGLDIVSHSKKIVIELKNRTNTDNASSRKSNFDKLSKFKKMHPEYRGIYANINADTKENTLEFTKKIIIHDNVEIEHWVGYVFLKFILEDNVDIIIAHIRDRIDAYYNTV